MIPNDADDYGPDPFDDIDLMAQQQERLLAEAQRDHPKLLADCQAMVDRMLIPEPIIATHRQAIAQSFEVPAGLLISDRVWTEDDVARLRKAWDERGHRPRWWQRAWARIRR